MKQPFHFSQEIGTLFLFVRSFITLVQLQAVSGEVLAETAIEGEWVGGGERNLYLFYATHTARLISALI